MPDPPSEPASTPRLLLLTVTFPHPLQLIKLTHCARVLARVPNTLWLVGEDAAQLSADVASLLLITGKPYLHLAVGPTRKGGNAQRNALLQIVKREHLKGIVYNMDDDNAYHPYLWDEIRRLRPMHVGVFAVRRSVYPPPPCDGIFPTLPHAHFTTRHHLIERPTYDEHGRFAGFEAGWCDPKSWLWSRHGPRAFCVDMAGYAFDAALLQHVPEPLWNYTGHGGESEMIAKLLPGGVPEDLQPLANCGRDVLVFHNEYRNVPRAVWQSPTRCGLDGWGMADDRARRAQPHRPWPSTRTPEVGRHRRRGGGGDAADGGEQAARWQRGARG
jgi:hypothetical protein